jgi:hypothetical protein
MHVIFGWLQVEKVILDPVSWAQEKENSWASEHPHTYGNWWGSRNILFVSKQALEVPSRRGTQKTRIPGAGVFETFDQKLRLSDPDSKLATKWRVPKILAPNSSKGYEISSLGRGVWREHDDGRSVCFDPGYIRRWQEAVVTGNPKVAKWAIRLIESLGAAPSGLN